MRLVSATICWPFTIVSLQHGLDSVEKVDDYYQNNSWDAHARIWNQERSIYGRMQARTPTFTDFYAIYMAPEEALPLQWSTAAPPKGYQQRQPFCGLRSVYIRMRIIIMHIMSLSALIALDKSRDVMNN